MNELLYCHCHLCFASCLCFYGHQVMAGIVKRICQHAGLPASNANRKPLVAYESRYGLRNRQKLQPPNRYSTFFGERTPSLLSQVTPTVNLTGRLTPVATLRQPHSEIHYDEVAHYGLANDNAIFSHAWAPNGCSMFACGGPLAMGVRGCHLAMWA
jgi:hypothetical protein